MGFPNISKILFYKKWNYDPEKWGKIGPVTLKNDKKNDKNDPENPEFHKKILADTLMNASESCGLICKMCSTKCPTTAFKIIIYVDAVKKMILNKTKNENNYS